MDFFVVLGFFVLLTLAFYNYSALRKVERKLEIFVRKEAIDVASKQHEKKDYTISSSTATNEQNLTLNQPKPHSSRVESFKEQLSTQHSNKTIDLSIKTPITEPITQNIKSKEQ